MTPQEMLKNLIAKAWAEFNDIAREEEADDYSDAMVSMDRTRAEGYAEGLSYAYYIIFNEEYLPVIEVE